MFRSPGVPNLSRSLQSQRLTLLSGELARAPGNRNIGGDCMGGPRTYPRILINHAPHKRVSNVISLCQTQGNRRACSTALSLFGNKFLTITQERNQTLSLLLLPNNHSWEGRSGHHSSLRCTAEAAQRQLKNHRTEHLHMVVGKMRSSDLLAVLEG